MTLYRVEFESTFPPDGKFLPLWVLVEATSFDDASSRAKQTFEGAQVKGVELAKLYAILPATDEDKYFWAAP